MKTYKQKKLDLFDEKFTTIIAERMFMGNHVWKNNISIMGIKDFISQIIDEAILEGRICKQNEVEYHLEEGKKQGVSDKTKEIMEWAKETKVVVGSEPSYECIFYEDLINKIKSND